MLEKDFSTRKASEIIKSMQEPDFDADDLFFDAVCMTSKEFMKSGFLDFLDRLCKMKKNANVFFDVLPSQKQYEDNTYLISHWVYEQPEPERSQRADNWYQIIEKIEEICQKHYGCAWGEQTIMPEKFNTSKLPAYAKMFDFDESLMDKFKYLKKLCKNRPIYLKNKFIGYCKDIKNTSLTTGHTRRFDREDMIYYDEDVYTPTIQFITYEDADEITSNLSDNGIKMKIHIPEGFDDEVRLPKKLPLFFNGKRTYASEYTGIHIKSINNVTVLEDRIVLAA